MAFSISKTKFVVAPLKIKEAANEKYVLVLWQEYMNKPKNVN